MMNWLRAFMAGRNGLDTLGLASVIAAVVVNVLAQILDSSVFGYILSVVAMALMVYAFFRIFVANFWLFIFFRGTVCLFFGDGRVAGIGNRGRRALFLRGISLICSLFGGLFSLIIDFAHNSPCGRLPPSVIA